MAAESFEPKNADLSVARARVHAGVDYESGLCVHIEIRIEGLMAGAHLRNVHKGVQPGSGFAADESSPAAEVRSQPLCHFVIRSLGDVDGRGAYAGVAVVMNGLAQGSGQHQHKRTCCCLPGKEEHERTKRERYY